MTVAWRPHLPTKRRLAYEFIVDQVRHGHGFPTYRQISDHMKWKSEDSARDVVRKLVTQDGRVERYVDRPGYTKHRLREVPE